MPHNVSVIVEFFQHVAKRVRGFTLLPQSIALVPGPGRRQGGPGTTRQTPPDRTPLWPLL